MSYWCEINFKKMEEKDIIPFLRSLKKRLVFDFSEIAKDNYVYCPFVKKHLTKAEEKAEVEASKAADEIPDAEEVEIAPSEVQSLWSQEQSNATCEHKGKYSSMHGSV